MTLPTTLNLEESTLDALKDLAQINRDSVQGFNAAADEIDDVDISALFRDIAARRQRFAQQLAQYVAINDEDAGEGTSLASKLHRGWIDVKGAITGQSKKSILKECQRGEGAIKDKYEELLPKVAGSPISEALNEQHLLITTTHGLIRDMCEACEDD